jgi:glycerol-3-phosphate acyltransferase PlsX
MAARAGPGQSPRVVAGQSPRVVLDAMGGDDAPDVCVRGALRAAADGVDVVLVGVPDVLRALLTAAGAEDALPIVASGPPVGMDEEPALALRTRRDASIRVAAQLVAGGDADALVSAGSTGATLAAALLEIGRAEGVRRPAVAAVLPLGPGRRVVLIDAGASADVQPDALPAYARMGTAYGRALGVSEPRVGLLNVGAEPGKGNTLAREAEGLLRDVAGFAGNVEPAAVLDGAVDVVVTDGFTGNIFLKTVEALVPPGDDGPAAAALLGVAGAVLVAHGAANEGEIARALRAAADVAASGLSHQIGARLGSGTR